MVLIEILWPGGSWQSCPRLAGFPWPRGGFCLVWPWVLTNASPLPFHGQMEVLPHTKSSGIISGLLPAVCANRRSIPGVPAYSSPQYRPHLPEFDLAGPPACNCSAAILRFPARSTKPSLDGCAKPLPMLTVLHLPTSCPTSTLCLLLPLNWESLPCLPHCSLGLAVPARTTQLYPLLGLS